MAQKAKRILYEMTQKVSNELEMLRKQDITEDVKNDKKTHENHDKTKIRLCTDIQEAINAIEGTRYPAPSLEDLINILEGSKIYCKLHPFS